MTDGQELEMRRQEFMLEQKKFSENLSELQKLQTNLEHEREALDDEQSVFNETRETLCEEISFADVTKVYYDLAPQIKFNFETLPRLLPLLG